VCIRGDLLKQVALAGATWPSSTKFKADYLQLKYRRCPSLVDPDGSRRGRYRTGTVEAASCRFSKRLEASSTLPAITQAQPDSRTNKLLRVIVTQDQQLRHLDLQSGNHSLPLSIAIRPQNTAGGCLDGRVEDGGRSDCLEEVFDNSHASSRFILGRSMA
jgi:hypothetical protein